MWFVEIEEPNIYSQANIIQKPIYEYEKKWKANVQLEQFVFGVSLKIAQSIFNVGVLLMFIFVTSNARETTISTHVVKDSVITRKKVARI